MGSAVGAASHLRAKASARRDELSLLRSREAETARSILVAKLAGHLLIRLLPNLSAPAARLQRGSLRSLELLLFEVIALVGVQRVLAKLDQKHAGADEQHGKHRARALIHTHTHTHTHTSHRQQQG